MKACDYKDTLAFLGRYPLCMISTPHIVNKNENGISWIPNNDKLIKAHFSSSPDPEAILIKRPLS